MREWLSGEGQPPPGECPLDARGSFDGVSIDGTASGAQPFEDVLQQQRGVGSGHRRLTFSAEIGFLLLFPRRFFTSSSSSPRERTAAAPLLFLMPTSHHCGCLFFLLLLALLSGLSTEASESVRNDLQKETTFVLTLSNATL